MYKRKSLYNSVVFGLLFFCSLQDFIVPIIYKLTGSIGLTNVFFYSKDFLLLILFIWSIVKGLDHKLFLESIYYLLYILILFFMSYAGLFNVDNSITSLLANVRMVILLPMLCCIGSSITNKEEFIQKLEKKWFPFVVIMAFIGITEYYLDFIVGTKSFWTDTIGYTNYYVDIKKQGDHMLFGLPANFYGNYGNGYFSTKRLVGLWANPLTSAYSMLPCCIYYFIKSVDVFRNPKAKRTSILYFIIVFVAIYLSHTRAILFSFVIIAAIYCFKSIKQSIWIFLAIIASGIVFLFIVDYNEIEKFIVDGSTLSHYEAVSSTVTNLKFSLFGFGIGYIGVAASATTECSYLTLLGNIGFVGLLIYMIIYFRGMKKARQSKENDIGKVVLYCSYVYLITGFISEQLFAFTTMAQYFVLLGLVYKVDVKEKDNVRL